MSVTSYFSTTYTPDYRELFAVQLAARRYHFTAAQRYIAWLVFVPYLAIVAVIVFGHEFIANALAPIVGRSVATWSPLGIIILVAILALWLICYRVMPALSARWLAQRKPLKPVTFTAGPDHLKWESEETSSSVKWSAIERLFLTGEAVCLLYGGVTLFLPRRLFSDAAALKAFLDQTMPHLPEAARAISEADPLVRAARGG
jgi:hypothetical protein